MPPLVRADPIRAIRARSRATLVQLEHHTLLRALPRLQNRIRRRSPAVPGHGWALAQRVFLISTIPGVIEHQVLQDFPLLNLVFWDRRDAVTVIPIARLTAVGILRALLFLTREGPLHANPHCRCLPLPTVRRPRAVAHLAFPMRRPVVQDLSMVTPVRFPAMRVFQGHPQPSLATGRGLGREAGRLVFVHSGRVLITGRRRAEIRRTAVPAL